MVVLYTNDTNGDLVWKITDFGFAAPSSADMSEELNPLKTGHMTRNYCAPEVIIRSRCEQSADIWSAGTILYELATGNPPFITEDDACCVGDETHCKEDYQGYSEGSWSPDIRKDCSVPRHLWFSILCFCIGNLIYWTSTTAMRSRFASPRRSLLD